MNGKEYVRKLKAINDYLYEAKDIVKQRKTLLLNELLSDYNLKLGDKLMCREWDDYNKFIICDAYVDVNDKVMLGLSYIIPMTSDFEDLNPIKYIEVNQAIQENRDYDNSPILHNLKHNNDCVKL